MDTQKFHVHIVKKEENFFELAGVSMDKKQWYILPRENRDIQNHQVLMANNIVINAIKAIKPINGFRKVSLKLNKDIIDNYFDEGENVCYQNIPLEEYNEISEEKDNLQKKIKELETRLEEKFYIHEKIEKNFILEKFNNKKNNASEWIEKYEKECSRHKIMKEEQKIEILEQFLEDTAKIWYELHSKNKKNSTWIEWKNSFLNHFSKKGWSTIRKAYNYKYIEGSLIDYLLIKEKLCTEIEDKMTTTSKINLMVMGLPIHMQEKLDIEEITSIEKLMIEIKKINNSTFERRRLEVTKKEDFKKLTIPNKKPCAICEKLGYKNRFHSTQICWNNTASIKKSINLNEEETENEYLQISEDEQKND